MQIKKLEMIDPVWWKVLGFLGVLFFVFLSDGILSDFVPGYMQGIFGNPMMMGIVMSTSSMVGLILDFVFPQIMRNVTVTKLLIGSIVGSAIFGGLLLLSTWYPWLLILVCAMAVWGIYFEFFGFVLQQFVASNISIQMRAAVWGVISVVRSLAYLIGPIVTGVVAAMGERAILVVAIAMASLGMVMFFLVKMKSVEKVVEWHEIDLKSELAHWRTLFVHVWPILTISILAGTIDALFWTTGTVVNDSLAEISPVGGLFLSMYMAPSLLVGWILARWGIVNGKKRAALKLVGLGGISLLLITAISSVWWYLFIVFVASMFFSLAWPLIDAVYSDLVARMGRERKHMIGLSGSTISISYVIGPIIGGTIATLVGEIQSFVVLGAVTVVVVGVLFLVMPRKLRLPQAEIETWE